MKFPGVVRAVGVATVNVKGNVTAINMLNPGARYVVVPDIFISSPVGTAGTLVSGSFIFNEIVTGSTSGTTARVKEYNADTGVLKVSIVDVHSLMKKLSLGLNLVLSLSSEAPIQMIQLTHLQTMIQ